MKKPSLPYLTSRKGGRYWYFRRGKGQMVPLPNPSDDGFLEAYNRARKGTPPKPSRTSIEALILSYVESARWRKLSPRSKADYGKVLDHIRAEAGKLDVSAITRPGLIAAQERNAHRARFANYIVQLYSVLCEHAIDLGWLKANPAQGIKLLPLGEGHKVWPAKAIEAYREHATGNALLIFELCLGTGQRIGDVLKMRWSDIEDGAIRVKQGKTGNELWIPLSPRLAGVLDASPRNGITICAGGDSRPLSYRRAAYAVDAIRKLSGCGDFRHYVSKAPTLAGGDRP